ncbi:hypothetical protein FNF29_07968 [Cafeteria roenbergensis]|uniref:Core domain-containing protein n=1 Tax=Cafeteria roenbergensis TaxID=33653 RepID=A0A5A8CFV5_CAFRO|nr:hypothetical protein FNF29_07968 [Cafeteria roenbergensis]KAA0151638.1 hypothetical protein FNF31_06807 [Cafeteria roenbergensis]|eukprot:KAA0146561.1 hypothetical protein FNF29_07968 [Cafeteria roenbergensis]
MRRSLAVAARAAGRVTAGGGRLRSRAIPAPIVVTEAAKQRLQTLKANRPEALGVRVGVKTRGCNGMSYTINWVDEAPTASKFADSVDVEGIKVYIEPRALLTIIGTTMDFQSDEVREGFVFENPQATDQAVAAADRS